MQISYENELQIRDLLDRIERQKQVAESAVPPMIKATQVYQDTEILLSDIECTLKEIVNDE